MPDITIPVEKLDEVKKIMEGVEATQRDMKENMISKEAAEKRMTELIEKALKEQREIAAKEKERKITFGLAQLNSDPCIDALRKAAKLTSPRERNFEMTKALTVRSSSEDINAFKDICDDLTILNTLMQKDPNYGMRGGMKSLNTYRKFEEMRDGIMKAVAPMDTTDTSNWVPTGMSSKVIDLPIIYGSIEPLFEHIFCPTKSYDYPINLTGPDTVASLVAEATTNTSNPGDTYGQTLTDSKLTLTAAKLRSRLVTSIELDEDSIVPMIPKIKEQLKRILDQTVEATILNGDTTSTHMDTDIEALGADDGRTAWKGIRRLTLGVTGLNTDLHSTLTQAGFRGLRALMGKFGVRPSELAWIVGPKMYIKYFLTFDDVRTVNVFGNGGTVLTGQLNMFDGIPVVVSDHCREDVDNTGVNGGSGNTYAVTHIVNHRYWYIGDRRLMTLAVDPWATTEQLNLLAFRRLSFVPFATPSATYPIAATGYYIS